MRKNVLGSGVRAGAVAAAIVTFLAYLPMLRNGFTSWDDDHYLLLNDAVRHLSWESVLLFFTSFQVANYHPLTLLVLATEHSLFGLDPLPYHAVSLGLHLANTIIVLFLLRALGGSVLAATAGALLFGVHPLHVESVAWIAEQKDVLCAFFYLGALLVYARRAAPHCISSFAASLGLFLLALLAKPMAVSLPLVLLLIDVLRSRPLDRRALWEKIPYVILAGIFSALAIAAQRGTMREGPEFPLMDNFLVASHGLLFYLAKALIPLGLSAMYPYPDGSAGQLPWTFLLSPLGVAALMAAAAWGIRRSRKVAFGTLFFLFTILPVLQIVPVGLAHAADRYFYIPSVGLCYLAGEGLARFEASMNARRGGRALLFSAAAMLVAWFSLLTWKRSGVWHDGVGLWDDVLRKYPFSAVAYGNRGYARERQGDRSGAFDDFTRGIALAKNSAYRARILFNRGRLLQEAGAMELAITDYSESLRIIPSYLEALVNRGNAFDGSGRPAAAIGDYGLAIAIDPGNALARYNRGITLRAGGDLKGALEDFTIAVRSNPWHAPSRFNRAATLAALGRHREALEDLNIALVLRPDDPETLLLRGKILERLGTSGEDDSNKGRTSAP